MRLKLVFFCLSVVFCSLRVQAESSFVHIENGQQEAMRIFLGFIDRSMSCKSFVSDLKRCLEFGDMFAVTSKPLKKAPSKKSSVQRLFKNEYDCALFVETSTHNDTVEWRLYDTLTGEMIAGKRAACGKTLDAYKIASDIIFTLTGDTTSFLSAIAYRKRDFKKKRCYLCYADFDGENVKTVFESSRIIVAPEWNNVVGKPCLFYSEFTPSNVRLMMSDLVGNRYSILDVDGTSVGVSYSPESHEVVYCRSGNLWLYTLNKKKNKGIHKLIVRESSVCASPILLQNGDIIYCCRGKIKYFDRKSGKRKIITQDGYCVGPAYSQESRALLYSRRVNGIMQLYRYDFDSDHHIQLTDDIGDKKDACWSPCGKFCLFCWDHKGANRIALLSLKTKRYNFITLESEHCSYPTWSRLQVER